MVSFYFVKDYRLKFVALDNHVIIFKPVIAFSLPDSGILNIFSIVLEKLGKVLSNARLGAEEISIKWKKLLKKMLSRIGTTIDSGGTTNIISSKVLLILFTVTHCFLIFKYELI